MEALTVKHLFVLLSLNQTSPYPVPSYVIDHLVNLRLVTRRDGKAIVTIRGKEAIQRATEGANFDPDLVGATVDG